MPLHMHKVDLSSVASVGEYTFRSVVSANPLPFALKECLQLHLSGLIDVFNRLILKQ